MTFSTFSRRRRSLLASNTMSPAYQSSFAFYLTSFTDTPAALDFVNRAPTWSCTFGRGFFLVGFSPALFSGFSSSLCHNFPSARDLANRPTPGEAFGRSFCLVNIAQVRSHYLYPQTYGFGLPIAIVIFLIRLPRLRFFDFRLFTLRFLLLSWARLRCARPRLPRTFAPLLIRQPLGGPLT